MSLMVNSLLIKLWRNDLYVSIKFLIYFYLLTVLLKILLSVILKINEYTIPISS